MDLSRGLRRRRARIATLGLAIGVVLLAAVSFAGGSAAKQGGAAATPAGYPQAGFGESWVWQKFLAQNTDAVETLSSLGIDVTDGTSKNPDGTSTLHTADFMFFS
jgi:hypothetical protein